jgi:hypothetical protein
VEKTDLCHEMGSVVALVCGLCTAVSTILVFVVKCNQSLLHVINLKGLLHCHSLQLFQTVLFNLHFWFLKGSSIPKSVHASYEHKTGKVMHVCAFLMVTP